MTETIENKVEQILNLGKQKTIINELNKLYDETQDPAVLYRLAKFEYERNVYERAKTDFRRLRKITGYYACSNYYLALIFAKARDHHNAIKHIEKISDSGAGYGTLAKQLYVTEAYKSEDYKKSVEIFEELDKEGLVTAEVYYTAAKSYANLKKFDQSIYCAKNAIKLDPDNTRYYKIIKILASRINKKYGLFISLLKQAISLEVPYADKLKLLLPQIEFKNKKSFIVIRRVEQNEEEGITSNEQKELYLYLLKGVGDYKKHLETFNSVDFIKDNPLKHIELVKLYNKQNCCEKALEECAYLREHNLSEAKIKYMEAYTYVQMGKYEEARDILFTLLGEKNKSYFEHGYNLLITLSYYLEGDIDQAIESMEFLGKADGSKIDSFLRTRINVNDEPIKYGNDIYSQNLRQYDYQNVYIDNRNRLFTSGPRGLIEGTNIGDFLHDMSEITEYMIPSYRLYKSTYLVDYGEKVGYVRDNETSLFIVDKIPGEGIYRVRPVIPVDEAVDNFQRAR